MTYEDRIKAAVSELTAAQSRIQDDIRNYPTPISGCDAQYNYLVGLRGSVSAALSALEAPLFVATPRTLSPMAGIESR